MYFCTINLTNCNGNMTIGILISTIDSGIDKVPQVLMQPIENVRYIVSMQYTDSLWLDRIPAVLRERTDVTLTFIEGRGLSRNRNNAIAHADTDICVIADDDCRYSPLFIQRIADAYATHPEADIIHFQALNSLTDEPLHPYPAPYVCSVELTFRNTDTFRLGTLRFDERFGLGSPRLCAGEEQVFIADAQRLGMQVLYLPHAIVKTPGGTTGEHFLHNPKLQLTKGATFRHVYGTPNAVWRSIKEAGWYLVHKHANPLPILTNMLKGILLNLTSSRGQTSCGGMGS